MWRRFVLSKIRSKLGIDLGQEKMLDTEDK